MADKAIRELRDQIIKLSPHGGPISDATLARATCHLNSLVRHSGRSARELWLSRDQVSGDNLIINDLEISDAQFKARKASHLSSARYSSRNGASPSVPTFKVGDMVFVKTDKSKSKVRDSYYVLEVNDGNQLATIQKFPMSKLRRHPIKVAYQNLYHCHPDAVVSRPNSTHGATPTVKTMHNTETASKSPSGCKQANIPRSRPTKPYFIIKPTPTYTPDSSSDSETDTEHCDALIEHQESEIDPDSSSDSETDSELFASPIDHPDSENDQISLCDTQRLPDLDSNQELRSQEICNSVDYQELDYQSTDNPSNDQVLVLYQPKLNDENYLKVGDAVSTCERTVLV